MNQLLSAQELRDLARGLQDLHDRSSVYRGHKRGENRTERKCSRGTDATCIRTGLQGIYLSLGNNKQIVVFASCYFVIFVDNVAISNNWKIVTTATQLSKLPGKRLRCVSRMGESRHSGAGGG